MSTVEASPVVGLYGVPPEARIGPSFAAELEAADLADWRLSWAQDGNLTFHPEMPEAEQAKVHAVLAAHDGPLAQARETKIGAIRREAGGRRAAEFAYTGPTESPELIYQMIHALAEVWAITQSLAEGKALAAPEIALIDGGRATWAKVLGIAAAATAAITTVEGAGTVAAVEAVAVGWPED